MWHFLLSKSDSNNEIMIRWIRSLENSSILNNLSSQGWYLPFKNSFLKSNKTLMRTKFFGPTYKCWENSWSFPILSNEQKIKYERFWIES